MTPDAAQRDKVIALVDELASTVETVLRTGLTTASRATLDQLNVSFREASRMRLLRLGSTLRIVNEEVRRYTEDSPLFSASRLSLFLNRTWLLSRAMGRALRGDDDARLAELSATPASRPLERVEVVALGVNKRVVRGVMCLFEFRLRVTRDTVTLRRGEPLVWTCLYPMRADVDLPAEAYLHLPQKLAQADKFRPAALLEPRSFVVEHALGTGDSDADAADGLAARLIMNEHTVVAPGEPFDAWPELLTWDPHAALQRVRGQKPGPLDLDVELTEEVVFPADTWSIAASPEREADHHALYPVTPRDTEVTLHARVPTTDDGAPLRAALSRLSKANTRPALYALLHYESCRLILQPLATVTDAGPNFLPLATDKVSAAELVKALKFDL
ncbi:MAG: hypothetical protein GC159_11755 [Phycisphaera sp.]|nr:hypothetical protein [Phycisphaera sp.]